LSTPVARPARAKINLALHVTGPRADGYHELDSIVGFADVGDRIEAAPGEGLTLSVEGPFSGMLGDPKDNLVLKAAALLRDAADAAGFHAPGARLRLVKNLPVASGLGGGSADAAATLAALARLWGLPEDFDLAGLAGSLGSDVPMCLVSRPLRATGRGERTEPLARARVLHVLLVNPGAAVSTPAVFAKLAERHNPGIGQMPADPLDPQFLASLRNDLEAPAIAIAPAIADVLAALRGREGCGLARMSGSGATCFGLFPSEAAAAAAHAAIVDSAPQWWSVPTRIAGTAG